MAHFPTPTFDGTALRVVMIGASEYRHNLLISGWSSGQFLALNGTADDRTIFELYMEDYVVQLLPVEETVSDDVAAAILQDAHAVIVEYDKSQPPDVLNDFYNVWIPRLERDATDKVFMVLLHHEVRRPIGELDARSDPDFDRLFESLPSSDKFYVEYDQDDDLDNYAAFRPVLFEAAKTGLATERRRRVRRSCCVLM